LSLYLIWGDFTMIIKRRFVIFSKVIFNTALVSLILSVMCQHTLAQESKILKVNSFNHDSNAAQKQRLDDHSSKRKIKVGTNLNRS
jgi:hypothetical protein